MMTLSAGSVNTSVDCWHRAMCALLARTRERFQIGYVMFCSKCIISLQRFVDQQSSLLLVTTEFVVLLIAVGECRWNMVGWPSKLDRQVEQVEETQAKDEDRFQKNLANDQQEFDDKLDSLEVRLCWFVIHAMGH